MARLALLGSMIVTCSLAAPLGSGVANAASPAAIVTSDAKFVPVSPSRLLDTRPGTTTADGIAAGVGTVLADHTLDVKMAPRLGIPDGATAVVLNVTAIDALAPGFVTMFPFGTPRPNASNLNIEHAGQTIANLVVVPTSHSPSEVSFYTSGGTDLAADLLGYFVPALGNPSSDGRYQALPPARIVDSRFVYPLPNPGDTKNCSDFTDWASANFFFWRYVKIGYGDVAKLDQNNDNIPCESLGAPAAPVVPANLFRFAASEDRSLPIVGHGGVPVSGVSAVVLNVTAAGVGENGFITVYPDGTGRPNASNLNVVSGDTRPNLVIVPVGTNGAIRLFTTAQTDLIVDVSGYFTNTSVPASTTGFFRALSPARLLDTRPGTATIDGGFSGIGTRGAGSTITLNVAGRANVPADATAVVGNLTGIQASASGFMTVYPTGGSRPDASNLNLATGQTVANATFATLGAGAINIYTAGATDAAFDVSGAFLP